MKRQRKNFLGCLGLVLVAAMTVVAYSLPSPDANAKTASGDVTVNLTVNDGKEPSLHINMPYDGYQTVNNLVDLEISFANTNVISGTITNDTTGESIPFTSSGPLDHESKIYTVEGLDISTIGSYGKYTIFVETTNLNGYASDELSFYFVPLIAEVTGHDKNGNPIVAIIDKSSEVDFISIEAYKKPGTTPLFNPALEYDANEIVGTEIVLPFSDYNAEAGDYTLELLSFTSDEDGNKGELIDYPLSLAADFTPPIPDVPETGAFFAELNISQADYLITGLIIFFIIGISLIVFMKKSSRR